MSIAGWTWRKASSRMLFHCSRATEGWLSGTSSVTHEPALHSGSGFIFNNGVLSSRVSPGRNSRKRTLRTLPSRKAHGMSYKDHSIQGF